ncbi:cyclin, N-terminal domain-containing protein, putative [Eimeria necatrix]|uniref:Cyclin, N-terminal domain-containing protein, putative n=1 Tax=Eimeria necatrix TaxID=51315 RepID=U6MUU4_9EIME|nr:cyclin, N-terminal domain-containing protein, putative [Eimeria necatrix]CDJ66219.1 cyclin, N-terminal domain-containing protein, putative [Eimeria necatrix]
MTPPAVAVGVRAPLHAEGVPTANPLRHGFGHAETRDGVHASRIVEASRDCSHGANCRRCSNCSCAAVAGGRGPSRKPLFEVSAADASIVASVASLLQHLGMQNSSEGCGAPCFLSATEPMISMPDYLERLARFFQCSGECFVLALVYIDRLLQMNNHVWLCPLNLHRLAVTALMVAVKFADDTFYSNAYYAKVGGLPLQEMNHLEATLLRMLHFRLHVMPCEFDKYFRLVLDSPFAATGRPRALGWNNNQHQHSAAPVEGPSSNGDGNSSSDTPGQLSCTSSSGEALQQQCVNTCCSPSSSGSTGCCSGSSQSVSPPCTPEASAATKSPPMQREETANSSGGWCSTGQLVKRAADDVQSVPAVQMCEVEGKDCIVRGPLDSDRSQVSSCGASEAAQPPLR